MSCRGCPSVKQCGRAWLHVAVVLALLDLLAWITFSASSQLQEHLFTPVIDDAPAAVNMHSDPAPLATKMPPGPGVNVSTVPQVVDNVSPRDGLRTACLVVSLLLAGTSLFVDAWVLAIWYHRRSDEILNTSLVKPLRRVGKLAILVAAATMSPLLLGVFVVPMPEACTAVLAAMASARALLWVCLRGEERARQNESSEVFSKPLLIEDGIGQLAAGDAAAAAVRCHVSALRGCGTLVSQLPTEKPSLVDGHRHAEEHEVHGARVSAEDCERLAALPGGADAVVVATWAALLGRYARVDEVAVAVQAAGKGWLPMRVGLLRPQAERPEGDEDGTAVTPASWYASIRAITTNVQHGLSALDGLSAAELQAVAKGLSNGQSSDALEAGVCLNSSQPRGVALPLTLLCSAVKPGQPLVLGLRFSYGMIRPRVAQRILAHSAQLVAEAARNPDALLTQLKLLHAPTFGKQNDAGASEYLEVHSWADALERSVYKPGGGAALRTVHETFAARAREAPDACALLDDSAGGACVTYAQLATQIQTLARVLRARGVGPDVLVPLMAGRGASLVSGIYGILAAGGAYVPLDTQWPDQRLQDVIGQCDARVLLATAAYAERLAKVGAATPLVCVEDALASEVTAPVREDAPAADAGLSHLVYVFFTSGTTGRPKGVMVEHGGLSHRVDWFQRTWPVRQGEAVMLKHSYTFGLSEWEIFWPLSSGATLVLPPPGNEKDPGYILSRTCGGSGSGGGQGPPIPYHVFVPSMLQMLLDHVSELEDLARQGNCATSGGTWWRSAALKEVIACSEPLTGTLCQGLFTRFPGVQLTNLYGPTEGEMTAWQCPRGHAITRVPVGKPMAGTKMVLTDLHERAPAASLEPAEMAFGGPFIARGYLGRPDLTAAAFVPDFTAAPSDRVAQKEARLYLTGDLGRWQPDGNAELLGRRDFQVKLRGFRIELGEVESAIRAAGARECVVVVRPGPGGAPALTAYFAPESAAPATAVRSTCAQRLPNYMRPTVLVPLDALPRNTNGKIDRKALPEPPAATGETDSSEAAGLSSPPETEIECAVAAVWAEVLGLPVAKVPADADFNALGGSSLLAGRVTALIRRRLVVPTLPGTAIYQQTTVRRLAAVVEKLRPADGDAGASADTTTMMVLPKPTAQRSTRSAAHPWVLFLQGMGVAGINMLHESAAWSPIWWSCWYIYADYGRNALLAVLPLAFVLDLLFQVAVMVMLKWLVCGRLRPGTSPLWGATYLRWWFCHQLIEGTIMHVSPLIADTSLLPALYRLLGARVGRGVHLGFEPILEPDLLIAGDGAVLGRQARIFGSGCFGGSLHLRETHLGPGAVVEPCAVVTPGSVVPAGGRVGPLSSSTGWQSADTEAKAAAVAASAAAPEGCGAPFDRIQDCLRIVVGLPILVVIHVLPMAGLIFILEWLWYALNFYFGANGQTAFYCLLPWAYAHPLGIGYIICVVAQKRLLVGRIAPGSSAAGPGHWAALRRWLHARAIESPNFSEAADQFVNTEVLCLIFRLLGTKVGRRVQMDLFHTAEHDCITIEDYVLFGSEVTINGWDPHTKPGAPPEFREVRLLRGANVLDHCCIQPGVTVGEKAVLGTCSLGAPGSYFPPTSISTGNVAGRAMMLKEANVQAPRQQELEHTAMRRLDSYRWWTFNLVIVTSALVLTPIPEALWVMTYFGVTSIWDPEDSSIAMLLLLVPTVYGTLAALEQLLSISLKWLIIGRYRQGAFPFFSFLHLRWVIMMQLRGATSGLTDIIQGTAFNNWVHRAFGAKIGKDCCLFGLALEYDLLTVGDRVAIGTGCDTTNHTVENMLLTLAPTKVAEDSAMLNASFVMPGGTMEAGAVLMENSQVLKGETVPQGEIWAGLPAARCG